MKANHWSLEPRQVFRLGESERLERSAEAKSGQEVAVKYFTICAAQWASRIEGEDVTRTSC